MARVFRDFKAGLADPADWDQMETAIKSNMVANSLFREWWRARATQDSLYGGEFSAWVSNLVQEHESEDS